MKITQEQRAQNDLLIKVNVEVSDYNESVEKSLRDYKRKANIPGFRPGMVPIGLVRKMYGKAIVAEQTYRIASDATFEYLKKENIQYVGDVIPSEEQKELDFDNDTSFEFLFEAGRAPEVSFELTDKDKVTYHTIKVDKKMRDEYRANFLRRFGRLVDAETVTSDEALTVTLDNGDIHVDEAYLGLISLDEKGRKPFVGKTKGFKTTVNIEEIYKTPSQRASILQVKENELAGIKPEFELEITGIRKFAEPEINDEFFKMAFPEGQVKSAAEFDTFIDAEISKELRRETDYLFSMQLRDYVLKKANLAMPVEFLKRWLYVINEGKFSKEDIEKDFDTFLKQFSWNFLQRHFIEAEKITVATEEAVEEAKRFAQAQFAQYGMPTAPDNLLSDYAVRILQDKEQGQRIYERLYEVKVVDTLKAKVTVAEKAVSADDFAKLAKEL